MWTAIVCRILCPNAPLRAAVQTRLVRFHSLAGGFDAAPSTRDHSVLGTLAARICLAEIPSPEPLHWRLLRDKYPFLFCFRLPYLLIQSSPLVYILGYTVVPMEKFDVVIVGAGPVGLMLSTCLARWGYKVKHIDNRPEPTKTGRADGIQPRSLDLLRNLGLKPAIMAYMPARVYEVAFWDPSATERGIIRTGTWASCPSFVDARYPFTTLLHQGFIERVFIDDLQKHGLQIQRPWTITGFKTDEETDPEYPVQVDLEHINGAGKETVRAKYLFGGEGSRSFVREQLNIGIKHKDPIAHVWGVMDGVVKTNFPDIKVSLRNMLVYLLPL